MPVAKKLFYCVKCRTKVHGENVFLSTNKLGRNVLKGKCVQCGTGVYRIIKDAEVAGYKRMSAKKSLGKKKSPAKKKSLKKH